MRALLVVVLLMIAGCAESDGDEPVMQTASDDVGGNETAEPPMQNETGDDGNETAGNATVEGNSTSDAGMGANETQAETNATEVVEPWDGSCGFSLTGVKNGGSFVFLGSQSCSPGAAPQTGYRFLQVTSVDTGTLVASGASLTIKVGGATVGTIDTGSNLSGSGAFDLVGDEDATQISVALGGTAAGSGGADVTFSFA